MQFLKIITINRNLFTESNGKNLSLQQTKQKRHNPRNNSLVMFSNGTK